MQRNLAIAFIMLYHFVGVTKITQYTISTMSCRIYEVRVMKQKNFIGLFCLCGLWRFK